MKTNPLNYQSENHTWEALKVIGKSLPDLFKNYNYLLGMESWKPEQEKIFEGFLFHLVFVIRALKNSNMTAVSHPWHKCLEVLEAFEASIKNGQPIPFITAEALNRTYQDALAEWDSEMN
ncbi:MAG: hypothetical protein NTX03_14090 [Bacteroidetes bacterium]|nr:hypothetical protein [Bacteroidota bacterium]